MGGNLLEKELFIKADELVNQTFMSVEEVANELQTYYIENGLNLIMCEYVLQNSH